MTESGYRRPMNLIDAQRLAGFWNRRADILDGIKAYQAAGDGFHVDRLLGELAEWEAEREAFMTSFEEERPHA